MTEERSGKLWWIQSGGAGRSEDLLGGRSWDRDEVESNYTRGEMLVSLKKLRFQ